MILATGPNGIWKDDNLYTMLDILNKPEVNISTVEDPIEYQMPESIKHKLSQKSV